MDLKLTIVGAALAFGLAALATRIDLRGATTVAPVGARQADGAVAKAGYWSLLASVDKNIAGLQRLVDKRADDWLIRMHLGTALLERAGLTNKIEDFERVQAVLDESFALVPEGSGPLLLAARFNFMIHRLAVAETYLDVIERRAVPRGDETPVARTLRAEIAAQRGQYEVAFAGLKEVAAAVPTAAQTELALYHAKTGKPAEAEALLAAALAATIDKDPRRRAWIELQRGILAMERGELVAALERLRAADIELSGWWLVQEHIAEVHHRRSDHARAIEIYEELVRTVELPQHMDALASLYRHTGETAKADALIARSGALWEQQLARFPESAMGHALQHHMQFGEPKRALELALANYALRPGGDSAVALARAHLKAGQAAEALAVAEQALATPYRTARLHDVLARAHAALGHTAEADQQTALCLAINPSYSSDDHSH